MVTFKYILLANSIVLQAVLTQVAENLKDQCGKKKMCISKPENCDPFQNCAYFMSYAPGHSSDSIILELLAQIEPDGSSQYVAVGFSKDTNMGDDAVTYCISRSSTDPPLVGLAYNPRKSNRIVTNNQFKDHVTLIGSSTINSTILCRISQKIVPTGDSTEVWSLNGSYHLLLATGPAEIQDLALQYHPGKGSSRHPYVSPVQINLAAFSGSAPRGQNIVNGTSSEIMEASCVSLAVQNILIKVHGILMLYGWWVFVASAILSARYYRTLWPNKKIFGGAIWFNVHRSLNIIGVLLIAAAFICIFINTCGTWSDDEYNHSILGMTASICAFVQPIISFVRCHPGDKYRPIFNWVHRIIGFGGFCCACAAVWMATNFDEGLNYKQLGGYGSAPKGLIIFYYVSIVLVFVILELLLSLSERVQAFKSGPSYGNDPSDNKFSLEPSESDQTGFLTTKSWNVSRMILMGIFVAIAIAVSITLSCFIWLNGSSASS